MELESKQEHFQRLGASPQRGISSNAESCPESKYYRCNSGISFPRSHSKSPSSTSGSSGLGIIFLLGFQSHSLVASCEKTDLTNNTYSTPSAPTFNFHFWTFDLTFWIMLMVAISSSSLCSHIKTRWRDITIGYTSLSLSLWIHVFRGIWMCQTWTLSPAPPLLPYIPPPI